MFIDTAIILIRSGKGGNGCMHMLRLKGNAKGGPDGGDGGKGGDIVVTANAHIDTLVEFGFRPHWFAQEGEAGSKKNAQAKPVSIASCLFHLERKFSMQKQMNFLSISLHPTRP